jgi:predicted AlkP superfamily pyrophosphatase or phosphodiesterase
MGERGEAGAVATAIQPARGYVVLLVDGLGSVGLQEHAASAQYLSSLAAVELTAGCPSTTVTSLTSLATGLPPGEHGLPGYTTWEPRLGEAVHWLRWHPVGAGEDLREVLPPEVVQPHPTAWEIAEAAGIATTVVNAPGFESTGLTRAAFRGGRYAGILADGDTIDVVATAADRGHRSLVYTYLPQLDLMGHVRGPGSAAWIAQLSLVDRFAALLAESLPSGVTLLITGDHGMVELDPGQVIDADGGTPVWADGSALRDGVVVIAGEPRMHHVHTASGALADVEQTWRSLLGDRAWVVSGDEAVDLGLFGPVVSPPSRGRIGDLVVFSRDRSAVVQSRRESRSSAMPGHHGSLTAPELLVPLLLDAR